MKIFRFFLSLEYHRENIVKLLLYQMIKHSLQAFLTIGFTNHDSAAAPISFFSVSAFNTFMHNVEKWSNIL